MDYTSPEVNNGALGALLVVWTLFAIAIYVVTVIGLWKMFVKAGKPGWAAIIPFYNWWVWVEIIGRPRWWFWALVASALLSWIPILGWILSVAVFVLYLLGCLDMAKCFGKGSGHGIGLWLLPFVFAPILGFGDAQYLGPVAAPAGGVGAPPPATGGYGLSPAAPAPPAPPAQPYTPPAPVTAPVTAPATPPTVSAPATPAVEAAPATTPDTPAEATPEATEATEAAVPEAPVTPPQAPEAPEAPPAAPPSSSPPVPPPLT